QPIGIPQGVEGDENNNGQDYQQPHRPNFSVRLFGITSSILSLLSGCFLEHWRCWFEAFRHLLPSLLT
ncbi:MAG: hypothetical protein ACK40X_14960, partial [Armatimonadota bacterium]